MNEPVDYYAYDLDIQANDQSNLGDIMYDILMCYHYCQCNNLKMVFLKEAEWFRGITYHDVFLPSFPEKSIDEVVGIWPKCQVMDGYVPLDGRPLPVLKGFVSSPPNDTDPMKWFGGLARELFVFTPSMNDKMRECIEPINHVNEDIVLCVPDNSIPLSIYVDEVNNKGGAKDIFLISPLDLKSELEEYGFVVHRIESDDRVVKQLLEIRLMFCAVTLIGGRASYMFRMAELMRHPLPSTNLKDSDLFGKAHYAPNEPLVRPIEKRSLKQFVNPSPSVMKDGFVSIPNFINPSLLDQLRDALDAHEWWSRAVHPGRDGINPDLFGNRNQKCRELENKARELASASRFTYMFWKCPVSDNFHHTTCHCVFCKLHDTFKSYEVTDFLTKLVGRKVTSFGEMFGSKYTKDDYLGVHHDKSKGDYAFVLGLTDGWKEEYGGILTFLASDNSTSEIIREVIPSFGSLTVFKVEKDGSTHHEVTKVVEDKERIAFTGWFNVEE